MGYTCLESDEGMFSLWLLYYDIGNLVSGDSEAPTSIFSSVKRDGYPTRLIMHCKNNYKYYNEIRIDIVNFRSALICVMNVAISIALIRVSDANANNHAFMNSPFVTLNTS